MEGDPLVRAIMQRGLTPLLIISVVYGLGAVALVSVLPRRPALIVLLSLTLYHYYGASTWLQYHFDVSYAALLSGIVLSALLVLVEGSKTRTVQGHGAESGSS